MLHSSTFIVSPITAELKKHFFLLQVYHWSSAWDCLEILSWIGWMICLFPESQWLSWACTGRDQTLKQVFWLAVCNSYNQVHYLSLYHQSLPRGMSAASGYSLIRLSTTIYLSNSFHSFPPFHSYCIGGVPLCLLHFTKYCLHLQQYVNIELLIPFALPWLEIENVEE